MAYGSLAMAIRWVFFIIRTGPSIINCTCRAIWPCPLARPLATNPGWLPLILPRGCRKERPFFRSWTSCKAPTGRCLWCRPTFLRVHWERVRLCPSPNPWVPVQGPALTCSQPPRSRRLPAHLSMPLWGLLGGPQEISTSLVRTPSCRCLRGTTARWVLLTEGWRWMDLAPITVLGQCRNTKHNCNHSFICLFFHSFIHSSGKSILQY